MSSQLLEGRGGRVSGGGLLLELLAILGQSFAGNLSVFGLWAMAELFALMFDDGEI